MICNGFLLRLVFLDIKVSEYSFRLMINERKCPKKEKKRTSRTEEKKREREEETILLSFYLSSYSNNNKKHLEFFLQT